MNRSRLVGVHTSIAGGLPLSLERALELRCTAMQIFSHNPRGWAVKGRTAEEVAAFIAARKRCNILQVFIHTSYLINLATARSDLAVKSVEMVVREMDIADAIGAEYVVLHTGSATGEDPEIARKRAIACLSDIQRRGVWRAGLLLENTAGERGDITSKVAELAQIMEHVPGSLISGVCIDTCHAFSAGYDIRSAGGIEMLNDEIMKYLGVGKIRLLHLNDSRGILASGLDRHEHIGKGNIGLGGFRELLKNDIFRNVPVILETPKISPDDDLMNLETVRKLMRN